MKRLAALLLWILFHFFEAHPLTPLITAAREGDVPMIRTLAAKGADPNEPAGVNDWTPLLHAIHKNQLGSVAALLDAHANPNIASPKGMTPLMMAAGYGQAKIVRLLLARGANPRLADHRGQTALDYARHGMNDIDRFTMFKRQDETIRALTTPAAPPSRSDRPSPSRAPRPSPRSETRDRSSAARAPR